MYSHHIVFDSLMSSPMISDDVYLISDQNRFMSWTILFQISNTKPLIIEEFSYRWTSATNNINRFSGWNTRIPTNIIERIIWSIVPNVCGNIHQFGFSITVFVGWIIRRTSSDQCISSIIRESTSVFMWIFGRFDPSILLAVKTRI